MDDRIHDMLCRCRTCKPPLPDRDTSLKRIDTFERSFLLGCVIVIAVAFLAMVGNAA